MSQLYSVMADVLTASVVDLCCRHSRATVADP